MEEQKCMIGPEYMRPVFALIDEKVTIEEEHRQVKRCIMDVLNAAKGLVSIDVNDVRDLFQEGGVIHAFDVSVDALMANRMNLMMVEITRNSAHLQSSVFKLSKDLIDSIHEEGIVAYTS